MFKIKGYNLQSFTIGSKHVRAFSLDNCSGIIIDFVLAECGAEQSPLPAEFYKRIAFGEGAIKLHSSDETVSYVVTRDNIVLTQRTASIEEELDEFEVILNQGKHIIQGTDQGLLSTPLYDWWSRPFQMIPSNGAGYSIFIIDYLKKKVTVTCFCSTSFSHLLFLRHFFLDARYSILDFRFSSFVRPPFSIVPPLPSVFCHPS
jgi:hypothetical protein